MENEKTLKQYETGKTLVCAGFGIGALAWLIYTVADILWLFQEITGNYGAYLPHAWEITQAVLGVGSLLICCGSITKYISKKDIGNIVICLGTVYGFLFMVCYSHIMEVFFDNIRYNVTDIFSGDAKIILNILFSTLYEFSWPILFFVGAMLMRKKNTLFSFGLLGAYAFCSVGFIIVYNCFNLLRLDSYTIIWPIYYFLQDLCLVGGFILLLIQERKDRD